MFEDPRLFKAIFCSVCLLAFALTLGITMLKIELRQRREDKVTDWEYVVDITKPPIYPPSVEMWDGLCETGKSKRRTADYERYSEEYDKAMEERKSNA